MRAMPGMVTVIPADDVEAAQALRWAPPSRGPATSGWAGTRRPVLRRATRSVRPGGGRPRRRDVTLISTGAQTGSSSSASRWRPGMEAHVLHVATASDARRGGSGADGTGDHGRGAPSSAVRWRGAEALAEHRPTLLTGRLQTVCAVRPNDALIYGLSGVRVAEQVLHHRSLEASARTVPSAVARGRGRRGGAQPLSRRDADASEVERSATPLHPGAPGGSDDRDAGSPSMRICTGRPVM
jgi:hypothetical protein